MKKRNELLVSDDEANEDKFEEESDNDPVKDDENIDNNHDIDLSISDGNGF